MFNAQILAEVDEAEHFLSDLSSEFSTTQKSGNIYSLFKEKENELLWWKEKYNSCSLALVESQKRFQRLQTELIERRTFDPHHVDEKCGKQQTTSPIAHLRSVESITQISAQPVVIPADVSGNGVQGARETNATLLGDTEGEAQSGIDTEMVSKKLFEKVMQQNKKMKKLLQDKLRRGDSTVPDYLERYDNEEVIKQLNAEIHNLENQVGQLRNTIESSDNDLQKRCVQLAHEVHNLQHAVTVRQALVDVYNSEFRRLRQETQSSVSQSTSALVSQLIKQVLKEMKGLKLQHSQLKDDYECKLDAASKRSEEFPKLQEKIRELQIHIEQLEAAIDEKDKRIARYEQLEHEVKMKLYSRSQTGQLPCGVQSSWGQSSREFSLPRTGLVADGVPLDFDDPATESVNLLKCPRCDKTFDDQEAYSKHVNRCIDE